MNKIILHIPHSSEKIPKCFWKNICASKEEVQSFVRAITDTKTLKLFGSNNFVKIRPKYSRVFCDKEKFADDKIECMSKFGMGVIYTRTNLGKCFLKPTKEYKNYVLNKFYYPYHLKLDKVVSKYISKKENVIIIDCHSFSKDIIMFEEKKHNLPDICLGYNEGCNKKLIKFSKQFFLNKGYSVKENYPYEGSIVPNKFINNKPQNLHSIMIEINKEKYLNSTADFVVMQQNINFFLNELKIAKIN